jgi:phage terminase large subunit-like protein
MTATLDLARPTFVGPLDGFRTTGRHVGRFIETLTLSGSFAGQPFRLMPFQWEVLEDIYRVDENGVRLRNLYLLGLARKNTKTQTSAGIALNHLILDTSDPEPLVISAAGDRAQARLVFGEAARMIRANPQLRKFCTVLKDKIVNTKNGGIYQTVSADAGLAHGSNPSCVIFDEYHVQKNTDLFVAVTSGMDTRKEPLVIVISTAGFDLLSPLGQLYTYGLTVNGHRLNGSPRPGVVDDPSFGMTWYGPEPGEQFDRLDPAVWERFNPAWPILNHQTFAAASLKMPESEWIRLKLNGWTSTSTAWLPFGIWDGLQRRDDLIQPGDEVVLGFDGSWSSDTTGLVISRIRDGRLKVGGYWAANPGDHEWRVPYAEVIDRFKALATRYRVRELACDPFHWGQALDTLKYETSLPIVEFPTHVPARMVPATKAFRDAVFANAISWEASPESPALSQHVSNTVLHTDVRGSHITKESKSSPKHIDLAVAAVVAHYRSQAFAIAPPQRYSQLIVV